MLYYSTIGFYPVHSLKFFRNLQFPPCTEEVTHDAVDSCLTAWNVSFLTL